MKGQPGAEINSPILLWKFNPIAYLIAKPIADPEALGEIFVGDLSATEAVQDPYGQANTCRRIPVFRSKS